MSFKAFIIGLTLTFGLPWVITIVLPYSFMRTLETVNYAGIEEDGGEGPYLPKRDGRIKEGSEIYGQEGCYYCHSQLIRPTYAGSDIWRKDWGGLAKTLDHHDTRRETNAFDYQDEAVAHIGISRVGPDLSNFGRRVTNALTLGGITPEEWVLNHLYNPRAKKGYRGAEDQNLYKKSVCPSKPSLFKTVDASMARAGALKVDAPEGKAIVPTDRARALASYLISLKKDTLHQKLPKALDYGPKTEKAE